MAKKKLRFPMKCPIGTCSHYDVMLPQEFALHVYYAHCKWRHDCPCGYGGSHGRIDGQRLVAHLESFDDPLGHLVQYDTLNKIAKVGN